MHVPKSQPSRARTCASASLRRVGDFERDYGGGLLCPFRIGAPGDRFTINGGENVFDHVAGEQPVDRRTMRRKIGCSQAGSAKAATPHRRRPCR